MLSVSLKPVVVKEWMLPLGVKNITLCKLLLYTIVSDSTPYSRQRNVGV